LAKDWRNVKEEIEAEIDRIWWDEPEEVTMAKLGIFPSGASVDGQVLGNLYFLMSDTTSMGSHTDTLMNHAFKDSRFTVDHLKFMWRHLTEVLAYLFGNVDPPGCPAPWFNCSKVKKFCDDIIDSFDTIKTKEELQDLLFSWSNYINCLNRWFWLTFPWHYGKSHPLRTEKDAQELLKLSKVGLVK